MKIIAFYSIKGGVGKTAACVNLAYWAARQGFSTLLCDLDLQGSASFYFRIKAPKKFNTKKLLKGGKSVEKNIMGTDFENLDLLSSDISYRNLDLKLDSFKKSTERLKKVISSLNTSYDFIFLDCPPSLTLVSENIFLASDYLLVPVIPTPLSKLNYIKLLKFFKEYHLDRSKIKAFFSMVENRKKLHRELITSLSQKNARFLQSRIPYSAEVEKMGIYRRPLLSTSLTSKASLSYVSLWQEIRAMINKTDI
jgi:cellulose biosynthesis protein BcsQ